MNEHQMSEHQDDAKHLHQEGHQRWDRKERDGGTSSKCGAPAMRSGGGSILELQPTDCTADSKYTFPFISA